MSSFCIQKNALTKRQTEDRRQKTEDRRQKTEDRKPATQASPRKTGRPSLDGLSAQYIAYARWHFT
ncbi:MAG: hypothetical protein ACRDCV_06815, partial [Plesiomonas shigelloides]